MQEWNKQRSEALDRALNKILYPQLVKEVKAKLLDEAKDYMQKVSARLAFKCPY